MAGAFSHLGFPDYFLMELAWAKLLGIVLLLAPVPSRLKEWAYAGFAFTLGSALIAHLAVGDGPEAWGFAAGSSVLRPSRTSTGAAERPRRRLLPNERQTMNNLSKAAGEAASRLISEKIAELGDWRGDTLAKMRALIREADPEVVEEWKWMGTPVWSHDGDICTGESYKKVVKLTFHKGAFLPDPAGLFNSSLDGNVRRAIDIHEGEAIDADAFKALVRAAVALNTSSSKKKRK